MAKVKPAAAPKVPTYRELETRWEAIKGAFVADVHTATMRDPFCRRYAYVLPSTPGQWGALEFTRETEGAPAGFELITAEPIPVSDRATIARWLERFAGRLPVFPL